MATAHANPQPRETADEFQSIDDLPPYADAHQVAAFLGQPLGTVRYWVTTGYIPSVRLGRSRRFPRESLRAWLAEQEQKEDIG